MLARLVAVFWVFGLARYLWVLDLSLCFSILDYIIRGTLGLLIRSKVWEREPIQRIPRFLPNGHLSAFAQFRIVRDSEVKDCILRPKPRSSKAQKQRPRRCTLNPKAKIVFYEHQGHQTLIPESFSPMHLTSNIEQYISVLLQTLKPS